MKYQFLTKNLIMKYASFHTTETSLRAFCETAVAAADITTQESVVLGVPDELKLMVVARLLMLLLLLVFR